jgi:hypothetical protein
VKDEFSIHVLKDVAISSALFRFAPNDKPCCAGLLSGSDWTRRSRVPTALLFWPRARRAEPPPTSLGCRGPFHDTNPCNNQKTCARGIGGGVLGEASIEGVRFRCKVYAVSRIHSLLTHRNVQHAGRRLKRAFRFRKFFGYFLPKKVTTRKPHAQNSALRLRHGMDRDARV